MRSSGVKNIVGCFRLRPPCEEKQPLASTTFSDNGSIVQVPRMGACNNSQQCTGQEPEEKPKMSLLRRACFLFSFNGYIAYFAVLLWVLPCRHPLCLPPQYDWETNISALLTTNMAATKHTGLPYSLIFGYSDESGAHLASLAMADGTWMWNRTTNHIFRHVFCEFDVALDFNTSPGCIVTAENFIGGVDASNGNLVWQQNISISEDEIIHRVSLTKGGSRNAAYVLGVSDAYIFVLDAKSGVQLPPIALPCSWTVDIKLVGPWKIRKRNDWLLVCEYGDKVEVWTIEEKELLSPPENISESELRDDVKFTLLFSQDSSIGSIDLAGDVTRTPDSLALSWADSVVMVTAQAPFHHLEKTWERRFSSRPLGHSTPVTSIVSGHFTDTQRNEIAVAVLDGHNTTVHILGRNGRTVSSTPLGSGSVISMARIPGKKGGMDAILIEFVRPRHHAREGDSSGDPPQRSYFTMQYEGKEIQYEIFISANIYASTLSQSSEGVTDLLTASRGADDQTTISRLMITSTSSLGIACHTVYNRNTSNELLLD